jgi:hypothetical protein
MLDRGIGIVLVPLRYVFYRVWDHERRRRDPKEALTAASFATAGLLGMNLYLVVEVCLELIDGRGLFERLGRADVVGFALALAVVSLLAVYWSCVSGRGYEAMTLAFGGESPQRRRIIGALLWIYALLSMASPILIVAWRRLQQIG